MGCWNATCNISNLPICKEDKIVFIPLIQTTKNTKFNACYPTDNFVPFSFAISGKYNDYGGIEDSEITHENEKLIRSYEFFTKNGDEKSYRKIEIGNDIEDFINNQLCNSENLYIKTGSLNHNDGMAKVNYFMAHQEIYEILIKETGNRIPYGEDKSYSTLLRNYYMKLVNNYNEKVEEFRNSENQEATAWFLDIEIDKFVKQVFCHLENLSPCRKGWGFMAKEYFSFGNNLIIDWAVNKTLFTHTLSLLRRGYFHNSGIGSQDQETKVHYLVAQFVIKHIQENAKKQIEQGNNCISDIQGVEETIFFYET
jgi:hypothetical protein